MSELKLQPISAPGEVVGKKWSMNGAKSDPMHHLPKVILVEGYGGFGGQAVEEAQRLAQEELAAATTCYQVADLDTSRAYLHPQEEFISFGDVEVTEVLDKIRADPHAYSDLSQRIGDLDQLYQAVRSNDDLLLGAFQDPPLGLIGTEVTIEQQGHQIEVQMMHPVRQLYRYLAESCVDGQGDQGRGGFRQLLQWFVFSSVCGGSGNVLARRIPYWRRNLLRSWGIRPVFTHAFLALPGWFKVENPEYLLANAYAYLLELMTAYKRPLPPLSYASVGKIPRHAPPFSLSYLVDSTNLLGRQFDDPAQGAQILAEVQRVMSSRELGGHYQSQALNLLPKLSPPYICSSVGVSGLWVRVIPMQIQNGYRLGEQVITHHLLGAVAEDVKEQNQQRLQTFFHQTGLRMLAKAFEKDGRGEAIQVSLDQFRAYKRQQLPSALDHYRREKEREWDKTLTQLVDDYVRRLQLALDESLTWLLNNHQGGLHQGREFLGVEKGQARGGLSQELEQQKQDLNRQIEHYQEHLQELDYQIAKTLRLPLIGRLKLSPRRDYLDHKQTQMALDLQQRKLVAQLSVVDKLLAYIYHQAQQIEQWCTDLASLSETLLNRAQAYALDQVAHQAVTITNVLCPDQEEALYRQGLPGALKAASQAVGFTREDGEFRLRYQFPEPKQSVSRLALRSEEGIERHLQFGKQFWRHLEDLSVEGLLQAKGVAPQDVAADLERRAAPLIAINQVKQHRPVITLMVMGSEHGAQAFFRPFTPKAGLTVVATADRHRIDFLYTIHGINPFALAQSEAMAHAYRTLRACGKYLHTCPESELQNEEMIDGIQE